jgi:hypothetical protein
MERSTQGGGDGIGEGPPGPTRSTPATRASSTSRSASPSLTTGRSAVEGGNTHSAVAVASVFALSVLIIALCFRGERPLSLSGQPGSTVHLTRPARHAVDASVNRP